MTAFGLREWLCHREQRREVKDGEERRGQEGLVSEAVGTRARKADCIYREVLDLAGARAGYVDGVAGGEEFVSDWRKTS